MRVSGWSRRHGSAQGAPAGTGPPCAGPAAGQRGQSPCARRHAPCDKTARPMARRRAARPCPRPAHRHPIRTNSSGLARQQPRRATHFRAAHTGQRHDDLCVMVQILVVPPAASHRRPPSVDRAVLQQSHLMLPLCRRAGGFPSVRQAAVLVPSSHMNRDADLPPPRPHASRPACHDSPILPPHHTQTLPAHQTALPMMIATPFVFGTR